MLFKIITSSNPWVLSLTRPTRLSQDEQKKTTTKKQQQQKTEMVSKKKKNKSKKGTEMESCSKPTGLD